MSSGFRALLPYLRDERSRIAWTTAVAVVNGFSLVILTCITAYLVAYAVVEGRAAGFLWWVLAAGLVLVRTVMTWHEMDVSHSVAYRILAALRLSLFDGYARGVPPRSGSHRTGELAGTALGDVEKLEFFYAHTTAQVAASVLLGGGGVVVLAMLDPRLAVVYLIAFCGLALSAVISARRARSLGAVVQRHRGNYSALTADTLSGVREVLSYGLTNRAALLLDTQAAQLTRATQKQEAHQATWNAVRDFAGAGAAVAVLIFAAHSPAVSGALVAPLAAGTLVLFGMLAEAVTTLAQLQPLRASAERVADGITLTKEVPDAPDISSVQDLPSGPLGFRCEGVTFRYSSAKAALHSMSLAVEPGERVVLAGPSGSGKTTLARLVTRLWQPDEGTIALTSATAHDVPLNSVVTDELTKAVTLVEQEAPVFAGTLFSNLQLAVPSISETDAASALRHAGIDIHDRLRWPNGLYTHLSGTGAGLSGGERARLSLARAIAIKPRILVLDEVTASVDSDTEKRIVDGLSYLPSDTTIVVITHRDSTVRLLNSVFACRTVSMEMRSPASRQK